MEQQREMPLMGEVRGLEPASQDLVDACRDELQAVQLCIQLSGLSYEAICDRLGMDKAHWTRVMHGHAHFPTRKRCALMSLCGNYAPLQFELRALGLSLPDEQDDTQREIRELTQRLEALKSRTA